MLKGFVLFAGVLWEALELTAEKVAERIGAVEAIHVLNLPGDEVLAVGTGRRSHGYALLVLSSCLAS